MGRTNRLRGPFHLISLRADRGSEMAVVPIRPLPWCYIDELAIVLKFLNIDRWLLLYI